MPEKTSFFPDTKKACFFAQSSGSRGQPKKHSGKNMPTKKKNATKCMPKDAPKKSLFLEFFCATALARPKKRNFFAQGRFPKYRRFFGSDVEKTAKIRPPRRWVRRHDENKYRRKGKTYSGKIPQKRSFFGDFSKWKLRTREFPRLFVI